tara:strand:+ start:2068 stop:2919 length:852 start_codon:yes stop_codon:yes gene_type:complete
MNISKEQLLSEQIENMLVERNLRGMKDLQPHLVSGYCLRAASLLKDVKGNVLIGTGFPVENTFETDGPVGAIILYHALEKLGATPVLVCSTTMAAAFESDYQTYAINVGKQAHGLAEAKRAIDYFQPEVIISIESPGLADNDCYHNMRGEDISSKVASFDYFMQAANCPTIAIGDGGNEIGMGNVKDALTSFNIIPSVTCCDELIISDVSNWGVYGILAFLSTWSKEDLLKETCPEQTLKYISKLGSVDGVTRKNELTEDSLPATEGIALISRIRTLIGFSFT